MLSWNFILIFVLGCLLVLNVILVVRDRENSNEILKLKSVQSVIQNELGSHHNRLKRDVSTDEDAIALLIKKEINRSILDKIITLLPEALKSIPQETLCQCNSKKPKNYNDKTKNATNSSFSQPMYNNGEEEKLIKCKDGQKGETGPRGPKGDRGEKGFSLIEPQSKLTVLEKTVLVSENTTLMCKLFGNPIPSVDWVLKGSNYEIKNEIIESSSEVNSYLTISNTSFENHGNVSCRGKSILGQVEKTGFINVHIKPSISLSSAITYVYLASNATFPKCSVVSNPAAKIEWKKIFGLLPTTRSVQSGFGDFTLTDVRIEDEGFYVCSAENYLGSDTVVVQLKTRPLKIAFGSPSESVVFIYPHTLWCGTFGRTEQISGSWKSFATGQAIKFKEIKNSSFYNISIHVTESGIYSCELNDGISTVERVFVVRNFTLQSNIIKSIEENQKIYDWLNKVNIPTSRISQCMQMSETSSYSSNTIWSRFESCYSKENTLLIIKLKKGYESRVLGGFAKTPWNNVEYSSNNQTFVFTTYPDKILKIKDLGNTQLCSKYSRTGRKYPCFGFEQFIFEETETNDYNHRNYLKIKSFPLLGSATPEMFDEIEIFYFI